MDPGGAPAVPASPPGPEPQSYGGEDVTLVPGRLRGYRSWRVAWPARWQLDYRLHRSYQYPPDVHLCGLTAASRWTAGDLPAAECQRLLLVQHGKYNLKHGEGPDHPAGAPVPAKHCSCGYYGLHDSNDYQLLGAATCPCPGCARDEPAVFGVIEGWGRVEIGPLGWRARHARIAALHVPRPRPGRRVEYVPQHTAAVYWYPAGSPTRVTETRMVERTCERAAVAYRELWHALAREYQVPIFQQWRDLVAAYPPTDLAALRRSEQFGRPDGEPGGDAVAAR